MSTLLKDIYSPSFFDKFSDILKDVLQDFDKKKFTQAIFDKTWEKKELKDRMRHIAFVLHQFMPKDFEKATKCIEQFILKIQKKPFTKSSFEFTFFPDYIEKYGIENYDASITSIEFVTQFVSCEFAVRPFIIKYGDKMIAQMHSWSLHPDFRVRRLASEGIRPRLPWGIALKELKKDPTPVLPLLENLKNDPAEWVRLSVANHLNDIAKDNPDIAIEIAKKWKGISKETDALIKHGCRTLLKQGNLEILNIFGLKNSSKIETSEFTIISPEVPIGKSLRFRFAIHNKEPKPQIIRLEYAIYYLRQNGSYARKVFKISEKKFEPNDFAYIDRNQSFRIITTRKFYPGLQKLTLIVNGHERQSGDFELLP